MSIEFRGQHAAFLHDETSEIDLEGALSSGKTVVCLWKELEALRKWPGIWILICRWTDDAVRTLLRPQFEQLGRLHGTTLKWHDKENYYQLENGSKVYAFGLKTQSQDPEQRYGKIRGLPVSRIYADQPEQFPSDIASELRFRLRPDIEAAARKIEYPRQLTFSPNPPNDDHWLAKQFPTNNRLKNRRYYALSIFDNAHNLPEGMIEQALQTYPPEHPKHRTMILGERGMNVTGEAIYENIFDRVAHVRVCEPSRDLPLLEAFECGRHNPVWTVAQRTAHGGLVLLGGIMGKRMMLEDFLPFVRTHRHDWFDGCQIKTCVPPMGESILSPSRYTMNRLLKDAGFSATQRQNANAPDVQLAMIEYVASLLRRRTVAREEALGIHNVSSRWLSVSADGTVKEVPFMAYAFEGGYVWSEHAVSVSNKVIRQAHDDDEYANAMRCVENIVLNFCAGQQTDAERDRVREKAAGSGSIVYPTGPASWTCY